MTKLTVTLHDDPGHAWLEVSRAHIAALGLTDRITRYSYVQGDTAYLEEDCDALLFLDAAEAAGWDVEVDEHLCPGWSPIRCLQHYPGAEDPWEEHRAHTDGEPSEGRQTTPAVPQAVHEPTLVPPPKHGFKRPRRWQTFKKLFQPIMTANETFGRDVDDVPEGADGRFWWTIIDCDGRLLLAAGFHIVNRLGYVKCRNAWAGERSSHPEYYY